MDLIDMHVHSDYSDGTDDVKSLVKLAHDAGLKAFALTDHDTVAGIDEAIEEAKHYNLEIIPGVELSCTCDYGPRKGREIHILGYFVNHHDQFFLDILEDITNRRERRNLAMCERLKEYGFDINYDEMLERFPGAIITRAHFGRMLLEKGYVNDIKQAFDKYIGDGCPCYVEREHLSPYQAIKAIHDAQGVAFLAHPLLYKLERGDVKDLIHYLKGIGLDGVEALYSTHISGDELFIRTIAKQYDLMYSGGSDYHGSNKPYIQIGVGKGGLKIGKHILDNIKEKAIR